MIETLSSILTHPYTYFGFILGVIFTLLFGCLIFLFYMIYSLYPIFKINKIQKEMEKSSEPDEKLKRYYCKNCKQKFLTYEKAKNCVNCGSKKIVEE